MKKQRGIFVVGLVIALSLIGAAAHTGYLVKEQQLSYAQR